METTADLLLVTVRQRDCDCFDNITTHFDLSRKEVTEYSVANIYTPHSNHPQKQAPLDNGV